MTHIRERSNYSRGDTAVAAAKPARRAHGAPRKALLAALLAVPTLALAAAGQVTHLSGPLFALGPDGTRRALSVGSEVNQGDTLLTEARTYARVKFADQGDVTLRPDTQLKVERYAFNQAKPDEDSAVLGLFKGALRSLTGLIGKRGNKDAYRMNTATATIGIRGTTFGATVCPSPACPPDLPPGTYVDVSEGAIQVTPPGATTGLLVSAGQFGFAPPAGTPQLLATDPGVVKSFQPPPAFTQQGNSTDPCEVR